MNPEMNLSPDVISALALEKPGHEDIIKQIMKQIEGHPEEQKAFITSLFATMAVEGDADVTDLRDAVFTIFADSQIQPILKSNSGFVLKTYLQSIRKQSWENDPYSGSIATLLDAGKVIASTLRPDKRDLNRIIKAWKKVSQDMPEAEDTKWIDMVVGEIEHAVGPRPSTTVELDNQVEALSNQGLNRNEIAKVLNMSFGKISRSRDRLLEAGRVEPMKKGRPKRKLLGVAIMES